MSADPDTLTEVEREAMARARTLATATIAQEIRRLAAMPEITVADLRLAGALYFIYARRQGPDA